MTWNIVEYDDDDDVDDDDEVVDFDVEDDCDYMRSPPKREPEPFPIPKKRLPIKPITWITIIMILIRIISMIVFF